MPGPDLAVILPAAGRATRFGGDKLSLDLAGRSVLDRSASLFLDRPDVSVVLVATDRASEVRAALHREVRDHPKLSWCPGGEHRQATVAEALRWLADRDPPPAFVAVHDAARPLASPALVDRVLAAARSLGAAVPGMPVTDTIKRVANGRIIETPPRSALVAVQTPQIARLDWFLDALATDFNLSTLTDDAQLLERAGRPVAVVEGEPTNLKLTHPADTARTLAILNG